MTDHISLLTHKLITAKEEKQWTIEQLSEEGPKHKRLQNQLLAAQLSLLIAAVEKRSGKKLSVETGQELSWGKGKDKIDFPVSMPNSVFKKLRDPEHDLKEFVAGPEHETLMYSMAIQVLHWAANTINHLP
jgi:hypothetical protein